MALIKLNDGGTKAVLSQFGLTPKRRLGMGLLCAVYEDGSESVLKLTTDAIQLESVRDYFGGTHFPTLQKNIGYVGEQYFGERSLYLFKAERLRPTREADAATRKLARQLVRKADECWHSGVNSRTLRGCGAEATRKSQCSAVVLDQLIDCTDFPETLREAFQDIRLMVRDYQNLVIDFHSANLMVRGPDELVLNDVIVDGDLLYPK